MTTLRLVLALTPLLAAPFAAAADHLVSPRDAAERLQSAQQRRHSDLQLVDAVLSSREGGQAAAALGRDARALRDGLRSLSDSELRDLAVRAQALQSDPVASLSGDVNQLLIIFLIIAIVILVLQAVD